eukprot:Phypoly_transcript_01419.p1 GENE.Phypoly_transcript_01419~~Phypoly_transcript_01419.p1  ORF type:complete len:980 (+),score=139.70 Phypoly_transcript_01419:131-3070(+)
MSVNVYGTPASRLYASRLDSVLKKLFPGHHIIKNSRKASSLPSPDTAGNFLELDFWIPDLRLAFEFQDPHHYSTQWFTDVPLRKIQYHDIEKRKAVEERGDTLVTVPYWWDGEEQSLLATIHAQRPEILPELPTSDPISEGAPVVDMFQSNQVPGIGELMLPTFAFYVNSSEAWWVSEKYDGVRACWNFGQKELYSRSGRRFGLLPPVDKNMLSICADGEIWFGRGSFHETQPFSALVPRLQLVNWPDFRFVVFDCPDLEISELPFEERMSELVFQISREHPFVMLSPCYKSNAIRKQLEDVLRAGGEGLVIRRPKSLYHRGRSEDLLKLKVSRDQEALVLTEADQSGDYNLVLSDGTIFVAKLQNEELVQMPKRGDVVTFSFTALSESGIPVKPRILRVRHDALWDEDSLRSINDTDASQKSHQPPSTKPRGYWTQDDHKNIRKFFDEFAKSHKFDPQTVENWYPIHYSMVAECEGGRTALEHYHGSLVKALIDIYPELEIDEVKFRTIRRNYWQDSTHKRNFFVQLAQKRKFDPLIPSNWYTMTADLVVNEKGGSALLAQYQGSLVTALLDVFPDIGLEERNFDGILRLQWINRNSRKLIFESIAKAKGFDPLMAENWYSISHSEVVIQKGGSIMLEYYEGSVVKALLDVYPNIGLDEEKFLITTRQYWQQEQNQRKFFDDFAHKHDFDPLSAASWYTISRAAVTSEKGGTEVLSFYDSLITALCHLYPDIGIDPLQFSKVPRQFWKQPQNRRKFFTDFAKKRGFDPLDVENWYPIWKETILAEKGGPAALDFYRGSLSDALEGIFPNLAWQRDKFYTLQKYARESHKKVFDTFAKKNNFDPLFPENWNNTSRENINEEQGGRAALTYYGGSLSTALSSVYGIPFNELHLNRVSKNYWNSLDNRKKFFDTFSAKNGFDPLRAESWDSVTNSLILLEKGGESVLNRFYGGSISRAILDVYPTVVLEKRRRAGPKNNSD